MWADELARMMREPNGAYNAEGKDHRTVMDERQDQHWLRPRTVVSLWQSEKYLDHFLGKLHKPITFYSVGPHQLGIKARPGYGDPEPTGPIFTPLCDWEVEPFSELVEDLVVEGGCMSSLGCSRATSPCSRWSCRPVCSPEDLWRTTSR